MQEEAPVRCLTELMLRLHKTTALKFTICANGDNKPTLCSSYNLYLCFIFVTVHAHIIIIIHVGIVTAYKNRGIQYPVRNNYETTIPFKFKPVSDLYLKKWITYIIK